MSPAGDSAWACESVEMTRPCSVVSSWLTRALSFGAIFLLLCTNAQAANNQFQAWTPAYLNLAFNDKWNGWYEVQPRFSEEGVSQLLLRTAAGYRFYGNWSAWLGYAWTPNIQPKFQTENRIFQQLLWADDLSVGRLTSRTRLEQRWIGGADGVAVRFRTLLRYQLPFTEDKLWRGVAQDEIFVNLNSPEGGPVSGFDQNRIFFGVNRLVNEHLNVDVGYQFQWVNRREPGFPDSANHVLLIQLFFDAAL